MRKATVNHSMQVDHYAVQGASLFQAIRKDLLSTDHYFTNLAQTLTVENVARPSMPPFSKRLADTSSLRRKTVKPFLSARYRFWAASPVVVLPDRALCLPTFSQLLIVNIS